ncbi:MAG: nitroreductase family protein [Pseudomonadota bacterium]
MKRTLQTIRRLKLTSSILNRAVKLCESVHFTNYAMLGLGDAFSREIKSVIAGQKAFRNTEGSAISSGDVYTLRRNTHRLEKGIIMRPRRTVFARDYISETVKSFQALTACNKECDTDLMSWSEDVLRTYFSIVPEGSDSTIDTSRSIFNECTQSAAPSNSLRTPYTRKTNALPINIDQLTELAIRRRSCRWYLPKQIPRAAIDKAMKVAGYSPSACNRQPFRFIFFDNPEEAAEVGQIPMGTKGFAENFPCFAVIVGSLSAFPSPRDRHVIYIDGALAAMSFQYALEVQGIGSCCINWPDIRGHEAAIKKRLNLKNHERVVMCMSLGYPDPDGMVPYSQKKPLDELREVRSNENTSN